MEITSQMRFEKLLFQMQEILENKSNITIIDGSPKKKTSGITMNQAQLISYIFTQHLKAQMDHVPLFSVRL